jgi:hypothetical protein
MVKITLDEIMRCRLEKIIPKFHLVKKKQGEGNCYKMVEQVFYRKVTALQGMDG